MPAIFAAAVATALLSGTAFAFTLQNSGFSATPYASPYPTDAAGIGPRATAWDATGTLWTVDAADGGLYHGTTRVNAVALTGGPSGLAFSGGHLYATLTSTQTVVELSTTNGAIARTLTTPTPGGPTSLPCPADLATDPLSNDLIVTGCTGVWRVSSPGGAPAVSLYATITPSAIASTAISIAADGTIFVVTPFGLYTVTSTASSTPTASPMSSLVSGIAGLAAVSNVPTVQPPFLYVTTSTGAIYKIPGLGTTADTILVLDGAGPGDQASVGTDGCVYASMGAAVVRVADANGTCDLVNAGIIPATLALANATGQTPHVDGAYQNIIATLTHAVPLAGNVVTFTVTGVNAGIFTATTDASGTARMSYQGHNIGQDVIVAATTIAGATVTSAPLTVDWQRAIDLVPPTISFSYTASLGGTGTPFACPSITSAMATEVTCGWFTQPTTIHWTVTAGGTSGLGPTNNCQDYTLSAQPPASGHRQICQAFNGDGAAQASLTVVIDAILSPPGITSTAAVGAVPYAPGSLTRGPVVVHYTCSSAIDGGVTSCPVDQTFASTGTFTAAGSSIDLAGQTTYVTFGPIVVDATPPVTHATVTGSGVGSTYRDSATVALAATDVGSGVASVSYAIDGTAVPTTGATASFVIAAVGSHTVAYHATDLAGNVEADHTLSVTIVHELTTSLAITSPPFVSTTGAVTARLTLADGVTAVGGEPVSLAAGGVSRTVTTDANGIATATLGLSPGAYTLTVTYAGSALYTASSAAPRQVVVYLLTQFVVWGPNASAGARVQFWGDDWAKQIADKTARKALDDFKGFADTVGGRVWSARGGDRVKPPVSVPQYVGVIVTDSISKTRDVLSGNVSAIAVLRVVPLQRYDEGGSIAATARLGERAFGTVLAVLH